MNSRPFNNNFEATVYTDFPVANMASVHSTSHSSDSSCDGPLYDQQFVGFRPMAYTPLTQAETSIPMRPHSHHHCNSGASVPSIAALCDAGRGINDLPDRSADAEPLKTAFASKCPMGQYDADKEIKFLTQQLERDMRLSSHAMESGSTRNQSVELPPPYHGPHALEVNASSQANHVQLSNFAGCNNSHDTPVQFVAPVQSSSPSLSSPSDEPSMMFSPKKGLTWQVTLPQAPGPCEAEIKMAALTQQIEMEMEQNKSQCDYFGEFHGGWCAFYCTHRCTHTFICHVV